MIVQVAGRVFLDASEAIGNVYMLWKEAIRTMAKGEWLPKLTIAQMLEIGVRSFPVVGLTSLFTGMVLAFQSGFSFIKVFNEPLYVGSVVGLSLVKELGPVLTSVVIAGRVGAAITAELGTNIWTTFEELHGHSS
jgi:phospholipid/cholesterol/gamma-HCH transport system permease protein